MKKFSWPVGFKINFNFSIGLSAVSTMCGFLLETNKKCSIFSSHFVKEMGMYHFLIL
jgi:hypothetical protein